MAEEGVSPGDDPLKGFPRIGMETQDVGENIAFGEFLRLGVDTEL